MNVPRGARAAASLVGIATSLIAQTARAERTAIGVRYSAPGGCPTEVEFVDNVRQRNPRVTPATALDPPQFLVTVSEGVSPRFSGRLERVTSTGAIGVREITGESCREVTAALALITALTADLAPPEFPPTEPGQNGVGASGRTGDLTTASVALPDKEAAPPTPPPPAEAKGVANIRWQAGLQGLLASGVTPNALGGFTLFGEAGGRGSSLWVPSVRLSGSLGVSSWSSPTTSAHAQFLWGVGSVDLCPLRIGDPLEVSVQPCARFTAGLLRASGTGRLTGKDESRLWTDAGGLVRVHWQVHRALFLDAEAEVFVPSVHYQFDFKKPTENADVAGDVGVRFGAGVGFVFR